MTPNEALCHYAETGDVAGALSALDSGADIHTKFYHAEDTALHIAARLGNLEMVEALLGRGASPTAMARMRRTPMSSAIGRHPNAPAIVRRLHAATPEADAAQRGWADTDETLLGAASARGTAQLVETLLDLGADPNQFDFYKRVPLHLCDDAMSDDDPAIMDALLRGGAWVDQVQNGSDMTALLVACVRAAPKITALLLKHGANVQVKNNAGMGPVHNLGRGACADQERCEETLRVLLEAGAERDARSNTGHHALHYAAMRGAEGAIRAIVAAGVDVNTPSSQHYTRPLHYAAQHGHLRAMEALLELGADVAATRIDGLTAEDFARDKEQAECGELLRQKREALILDEQVSASRASKPRL